MGRPPALFFGVSRLYARVTSWILEEANSKGYTVFQS